jgi:polysaccharide export outer membrane protein
VTGAVGKPGVIQLRGSRTLLEVVTEAGGLREDAGSNVTVTRKSEWGGIPLSSAVADPSKQFNIVRINLRDVMDGKKPQENIVVKPFDVIAIPRAEQVYVFGDVEKAGNISLHDREGITVLQAVSMAGGLKKTASAGGARILRAANGDAPRSEVMVNLSALEKGKGKDISLEPGDVLFIPTSLQKQVTGKAVETAIQLGVGILVWGRN